MKIYKLDIDTSKPIRKVVQMQQNATGALSVDVKNDGWPIRNLSCALYDGETELSAYSELSTGAGYKIDMGDETKIVKLTAKSTPIECSSDYIVSNTGNKTKQAYMNQLQIEAGTYRQDEFYNIVNKFGSSVLATFLNVDNTSLSNVNFSRIVVVAWNNDMPVQFVNNTTLLAKDELIVATGPVRIGEYRTVKNNAVISSEMYPAIGYYTDYSLDTVIRPSENAHCYAEQEVADPTPDPEPEPDPDPTPDPDDPPAETTEG